MATLTVLFFVFGILATAMFDLYLAFIQPRLFGAPFTGFALFGRWLGHLPKGQFFHQDMTKAAPIAHEKLIGWIGHYAVGILFAGILLLVGGFDWVLIPTLGPALAVGVLSVVAPLCLMQPAFGMGFFASRTPKPWLVCLRSLVSHTVFGLCLYAAGLLVSLPIGYFIGSIA